MKRDMDLARKILIALEEREVVHPFLRLEVQGFASALVSHHVWLLNQAGLIEANNASTADGDEWFPVCLTWEGHEFLDAARNDTTWNKAKALVLAKAGGLSFEALQFALTEIIKKALQLP